MSLPTGNVPSKRLQEVQQGLIEPLCGAARFPSDELVQKMTEASKAKWSEQPTLTQSSTFSRVVVYRHPRSVER